jgi:hypothetical protein
VGVDADGGGNMDSATVRAISGRTDSRPVVLLEAPENEGTADLWEHLEAAGYEVAWCPGPTGPPPVWCPLLGGARCDLVESADAVVCGLGSDDRNRSQVLGALQRLHSETPVIVPDTNGASTCADAHDPRVVAFGNQSSRDIVTAIEAALRLCAH